MTAKAFFEGSRRLDERISTKVDELERARACACRMTASYSDMPRGGSRTHSAVENAVARMMELEQQINDEIDELVERRSLAKRIFEAVSDNAQRDVLAWRYFSHWSWDKIADALGVSRAQVWRVHGLALLEAERVMTDKEVGAALVSRDIAWETS